MALITCPDCGQQVSSEAKACPRCARPLSVAQQTVEATAKRWKLIQLFGGIVAAIGIVGQVAVVERGPNIVAISVMGIGLAVAIAGRTLAWWFHG